MKLSGEDLSVSRYSNKSESVGLRTCPYYHYLNVTITNIYQSLPHIMAGTQLASYEKLRHCHFMYIT